MSEDALRIYLVIRTDIGIPEGKLAVQAMHGALGLYQKCLENDPELINRYLDTEFQYKICLRAKNENMLERVQRECEEAGIPTFMVEDVGFTVFSGPTATALALGPVFKNDLPKYIQRLQLFK